MPLRQMIIVALFLALAGSTVASQSVKIYQTVGYGAGARWFIGTEPNRVYLSVDAWTGTEKVGTTQGSPVAGAQVGLAVEQADGSFLPEQVCYPSGTDGTTVGFKFPTGAFGVAPNLESAHLSLKFDCFNATYPYDHPTGTSLEVDLDWSGSGPMNTQTHNSSGYPGGGIGLYRDGTAVGTISDGVREYAADPPFWAAVSHGLNQAVVVR